MAPWRPPLASWWSQLISAFYHNVTADALACLGAEQLWELVQERGFPVLGVEAAWCAHLDRGWQRRALTWEGQSPGERQVALQLAARRSGPDSLRATPALRPGLSQRLLRSACTGRNKGGGGCWAPLGSCDV